MNTPGTTQTDRVQLHALNAHSMVAMLQKDALEMAVIGSALAISIESCLLSAACPAYHDSEDRRRE